MATSCALRVTGPAYFPVLARPQAVCYISPRFADGMGG